MDKTIRGIWRSYKLFFFSGKAEQHDEATFMELAVNDGGTLTLLHSSRPRDAVSYSASQWRIDVFKGRRYLYLLKRQAFEIITMEAEDLVLYDLVKGDKTFFAKMPGWYQRIEPATGSVRHVQQEEEQKESKDGQ
jgi:hypothetical protein